MICGVAGALYYPQAGIINPDEIAPIASIYLAVWVAIGGRGRLYGAVIGAAVVSLLSTFFTSGRAPDVDLGFYEISWIDWWPVLLGLGFVLVTLFAPKGLAGSSTTSCGRRTDEHASGGPRRLRLLRRVQGDQQPELHHRLAGDAGGDRPERGRQDDLHGHRHRQDPARYRHRALGRDGSFAPVDVRGADRARGDRAEVPAPHRLRGPERAGQPARGPEETARSLRAMFDRVTPEDRARIEEIATEIGLGAHLDRKAGILSHGQKQWLEIGMLLAQDPRLLLVDEPAAGMTTEERNHTADLLKRLARVHAVVVVEHDMEFVRRLDCRVTVLHEGSVLAEGSLEHVMGDERVIEVYLGR
jgi:hypothetical protein